MKTLRWILPSALGLIVAAILLGRIARTRAIGISSAQAQRLVSLLQAAYASTVAALEPTAVDASDFDERDARAASDAEALRQGFDEVRSTLAPGLSSAVAAFVDHIITARVQIAAFAINRKNRGLPDAAQAEAETEDRRNFQQNAQPVLSHLVAALS
ncbi:MAG: hypothetical protein JO060_07400 [Candidatus Eremiobacteraeota bacterium]|nr:hypothetical protein [Candidatus Eremiobacteraeota bacterium]MBV9646842.1 hypothetical protein [Candidatus Eremiobacteraeota bacterium]